MYKLYITYLFETLVKGYYDDLDVAKYHYTQWKYKYQRQGYAVGEDNPPVEVKSDTEWVTTMTRIPFYGEYSGEPTGMTDTIEIHLELQSRVPVMPNGIPCFVNPIVERVFVEPSASAIYERWIEYAKYNDSRVAVPDLNLIERVLAARKALGEDRIPSGESAWFINNVNSIYQELFDVEQQKLFDKLVDEIEHELYAVKNNME